MKVRKIDSSGLKSLGASSPLKGLSARSSWVCAPGVDADGLDDAEREKQCRQVTLAELSGDDSDELGEINQPTKVSLRALLKKGVELEDCVIEGRTMRCTIRGLEAVDDADD